MDDRLVCIFSTYLYPNGDLLVVFHGLQQIANGYGLAKLDKDSNVLWKYAANVHHDVDVGEDGTIYAIQHKRVAQMPTGLEFIPTPTLVDSLVLLSPEGKPLRKPIPLLELIRDSPYAVLLDSLDRSGKKDVRPNRLVGPGFDEEVLRQDVLHTNCVKVLPRRLAAKFSAFRPGQVLLSFCDLDTIAVVDLDKKAMVWAARGPWQAQNDAQSLDNGHLLLFDNRGLPKGSRVLEYDPQTQAFPWSYTGPNGRHFYSNEGGMCQRLPNGNTLVVNSEGGEIQEVTHDKEVVWSCSTGRFISTARRYGPEQVPFLKGEARVPALNDLLPLTSSAPRLGSLLAYVGLGPGQEMIPYFWGLLSIMGAALLGILQWPFLVLFRRLRRCCVNEQPSGDKPNGASS